MTRTQRTLLYVGSGLVTGIAIAMIVLFTMSRTQFGMERVRLLAIDWLTERVDGTVHVGSIGGRGLLGGVTLREFYITDKHGRPFMRMDSVTLSYNWRTLARGEIVLENAVLYHPEIALEKLPGDTIWNYQHVFPDRSEPGVVQGPRRLIMFSDARVVNGTATVRMPFELDPVVETERMVIDTFPGGYARVMLFDSLHGQLSRVIWESPAEKGRLVDIRSMRGRAFVWRDPAHITGARGTVTLRDSIVAFDLPDIRLPTSRGSVAGRVIMEEGLNFYDVRADMQSFNFSDLTWLYPRLPESGGGSGTLLIQSQRPRGILWLARNVKLAAPGTRVAGSFGVVTGADSLYFTNVDLRASPLDLDLIQNMLPERLPLDGLLVGTVEVKGLSSLETKGDIYLPARNRSPRTATAVPVYEWSGS